jgi:hypothetical protein
VGELAERNAHCRVVLIQVDHLKRKTQPSSNKERNFKESITANRRKTLRLNLNDLFLETASLNSSLQIGGLGRKIMKFGEFPKYGPPKM